jgi:POT family proton-dependent oligopeptide transporter
LALFVEHVAAILGGFLLFALGAGLFKAGVLSMLGRLFPPDDPRRADGLSLFYAAINLGALSAPLVGNFVKQPGEWLSVFVLASCGMLVSLSVLSLSRPYLRHVEQQPAPLNSHVSAQRQGKGKVRAALLLLAGLVYGVGYVQSYSSLLLWVRDRTDRRVGPFDIPIAWFAAAPAALVLLIAPLLSAGFRMLRRHGREPSTVQKVVLGLFLACLAFVPLWVLPLVRRADPLVSPLWVLTCLAMLSTAELLVPALAPAEIQTMAPKGREGRWLSYWLVAFAGGQMLGGWIHF